MAQKTKQQLKNTLVNGHLVTGGDFTDLVDSLKGLQSPVNSPSASGSATAFIDSISQDTEGVVTVTKKSVDFFSGTFMAVRTWLRWPLAQAEPADSQMP